MFETSKFIMLFLDVFLVSHFLLSIRTFSNTVDIHLYMHLDIDFYTYFVINSLLFEYVFVFLIQFSEQDLSPSFFE